MNRRSYRGLLAMGTRGNCRSAGILPAGGEASQPREVCRERHAAGMPRNRHARRVRYEKGGPLPTRLPYLPTAELRTLDYF